MGIKTIPEINAESISMIFDVLISLTKRVEALEDAQAKPVEPDKTYNCAKCARPVHTDPTHQYKLCTVCREFEVEP